MPWRDFSNKYCIGKLKEKKKWEGGWVGCFWKGVNLGAIEQNKSGFLKEEVVVVKVMEFDGDKHRPKGK